MIKGSTWLFTAQQLLPPLVLADHRNTIRRLCGNPSILSPDERMEIAFEEA